jgi:soluble lytic murein transglycosylase-like protein
MMVGLPAQFGGDYAKELAAYTAGAGAVNSAVAQGGGNWLAYMPAETRNYVHVIRG